MTSVGQRIRRQEPVTTWPCFAVCKSLGLPVNDKKCLGPSTCLEILGIEVDTVAMEARLSSDRVRRIVACLSAILQRRSTSRLELQQAAGLLVFACRVVPQGRVFLQRIWTGMRSASDYRRRVSTQVLDDIQWWLHLLPEWSGIRYLHPVPLDPIHLWTDASGTTGAGGHLGPAGVASDAFAYSFPNRHRDKHITFKELHAVVHAVALFSQGTCWRGRQIVIHTDNTAVASAVVKGYIKHVASQSLLRRLWLRAAAGGFTFLTIWLPSRENGLADALSRFNWAQANKIDASATGVALRRRQDRNSSIPRSSRPDPSPSSPRQPSPLGPSLVDLENPQPTSSASSTSTKTRRIIYGWESGMRRAHRMRKPRKLSPCGQSPTTASRSPQSLLTCAGGQHTSQAGDFGPGQSAAHSLGCAPSIPTLASTTLPSTVPNSPEFSAVYDETPALWSGDCGSQSPSQSWHGFSAPYAPLEACPIVTEPRSQQRTRSHMSARSVPGSSPMQKASSTRLSVARARTSKTLETTPSSDSLRRKRTRTARASKLSSPPLQPRQWSTHSVSSASTSPSIPVTLAPLSSPAPESSHHPSPRDGSSISYVEPSSTAAWTRRTSRVTLSAGDLRRGQSCPRSSAMTTSGCSGGGLPTLSGFTRKPRPNNSLLYPGQHSSPRLALRPVSSHPLPAGGGMSSIPLATASRCLAFGAAWDSGRDTDYVSRARRSDLDEKRNTASQSHFLHMAARA